MRKLRWLYLNGNKLSGNIPVGISHSSRLAFLWLSDNKLSGPLEPSLFANNGFKYLKELLLHDNQLTGPIPEEIGMLPRIRFISMNQNKISGTIPTTLGMLTDLEVLKLHNTDLTGSVPEEVCHLVQRGTLKMLTIDCRQVACDCECSCNDDEDELPEMTGGVPDELPQVTSENQGLAPISDGALTSSVGVGSVDGVRPAAIDFATSKPTTKPTAKPTSAPSIGAPEAAGDSALTTQEELETPSASPTKTPTTPVPTPSPTRTAKGKGNKIPAASQGASLVDYGEYDDLSVSVAAEFMVSLPDFTKEALLDDSSPQSMAFDWMQRDPNLSQYSYERKTQRFGKQVQRRRRLNHSQRHTTDHHLSLFLSDGYYILLN